MPTVSELDSRPRRELVQQASDLGVERPERMTRVELRDEILRRTVPPEKQAETRGLFGVARSMIASVVQTGLNLPEAAKAIRGDGSLELPLGSQTPVATVTLAEIYAAQGHRSRALRMIEEVLASEPDHEEALRVRAHLDGAFVAPRTDPLEALAGSEPTTPETSEHAAPPQQVLETQGEEVQTGQPPAVSVETSDAPPPVAQPVPDEASPSLSGAPEEPGLVLIQGPDELCLYWEFPDEARRVLGTEPRIELVGFVPAGSSPERVDRGLSLLDAGSDSRERGIIKLSGWGSDRAVRAALGGDDQGQFRAVVLGRSIEECSVNASSRAFADRAARAL